MRIAILLAGYIIAEAIYKIGGFEHPVINPWVIIAALAFLLADMLDVVKWWK